MGLDVWGRPSDIVLHAKHSCPLNGKCAKLMTFAKRSGDEIQLHISRQQWLAEKWRR